MIRYGASDLEIARALLRSAREAATEEDDRESNVRVFERLSLFLTPLVGVAGLRALVNRSAKLTADAHPGFAALASSTRSSDEPVDVVEALRSCLATLDAAAHASAAAALYATLIALLSSLIGDRLVSTLLRNAFPDLAPSASKETER